MNNKSKILLESGTNELELMEFIIDNSIYGINIAKIKEIIVATKVEPIPNSNENIEGVFKYRDTIIPVLNLPHYLKLNSSDENNKDIFIITYFNKTTIAFRVHSIQGIKRISWTDIKKPDNIIYSQESSIATGIITYDDKIVTVIDFEKILSDVSPSNSIDINDVNVLSERDERNNVTILIAEDSVLLSKIISDCLKKAGFKNIISCADGQQAYDYINSIDRTEVCEHISIIITDIEMPRMDGHRLTKFIKEDDILKDIPVIIFSSLINEDMYRKGKELGADEQITKPEIVHLVQIIDTLLEKYNKKKE